MKRGEPLKRTGGLKRTGELKRTGSLSKGKRRKTDPALAEAFYRRVTISPLGRPFPCMVCDEPLAEGEGQAHHCIEKSWIKTELRTLDWETQETWIWDHRNGVALHSHCHEAHTNASKRIPRAWLPQAVWDFAAELDELIGTRAATQKLLNDYPGDEHEDE